jgi:hypothetical protein
MGTIWWVWDNIFKTSESCVEDFRDMVLKNKFHYTNNDYDRQREHTIYVSSILSFNF